MSAVGHAAPSVRRAIHEPRCQPLSQGTGKSSRRGTSCGATRICGGSVAEEVTALPLSGGPAVRFRLKRGAQDQLAEILRCPVLGLAFAGGLPPGREQAGDRLAPLAGQPQGLLPPFPGRNAGDRVQIQEDLLGKPGSCSTSRRFNAAAGALSRLEWLRKTRAMSYHP